MWQKNYMYVECINILKKVFQWQQKKCKLFLFFLFWEHIHPISYMYMIYMWCNDYDNMTKKRKILQWRISLNSSQNEKRKHENMHSFHYWSEKVTNLVQKFEKKKINDRHLYVMVLKQFIENKYNDIHDFNKNKE